MSTLPETTLAHLRHLAAAGQYDAKAILHLIARADAQDQWFAKFTDSYSKTIAALCRRLEAMERGAGLRHPVEDDATQPDSVADAAQRITDHAAKAGLTVQDWAKAFNAAQVDASPVVNALLVAESALADVAEGEAVSPHAVGCLHWAEARCTEALAAIRPVMRRHGIRTSDLSPANLSAALKAEPEEEGLNAADLLPVEPPNIPTTMAMQYRSAWREGVEDGWSEARAILARQGHPHAAAPAPGENLATPPAPEDLAIDQMMAANLSALLIKECGLHSPCSSTHDLLQRAAAMLVNYGLPARPTTPPAPEPGEVGEVAQWLHAHALDCRVLGRNDWAEQCTRAATLLQQQESELAALRVAPGPTFQDAIHLAQGCHDYSGGHSGAEGEAWHGAIDTVVAVLKRAAIKPWDGQLTAVYGVGVDAGEVEA
jgi:hypothetical protein